MELNVGETRSHGGEAAAATERNKRGIKRHYSVSLYLLFNGIMMVNTTMKNPK
jgi:hypothetical protein